jgi:hypothetical protein
VGFHFNPFALLKDLDSLLMKSIAYKNPHRGLLLGQWWPVIDNQFLERQYRVRAPMCQVEELRSRVTSKSRVWV